LTDGSALSHAWVPATCTAAKTCTVCGETEGAALGHTPGGPGGKCIRFGIGGCDYIFGSEPVHIHEAGAAATCLTAQTCIRCDYVFEEALGHDESGAAATCTTDKVCARDGCDIVIVPALGHSFGNWRVVTAATCTADGQERRDCSVCSVFETKPVPQHDHIDTNGNGKCDDCGVVFAADTFGCNLMHDHRFGINHHHFFNHNNSFWGKVECFFCMLWHWILRWVLFGWAWIY
jgi:hypothetical protein